MITKAEIGFLKPFSRRSDRQKVALESRAVALMEDE